jgi:Icc-related predicted phosphoesterase
VKLHLRQKTSPHGKRRGKRVGGDKVSLPSIQILSDLHFDVEDVKQSVKLHEQADILVVAGDVCEGLENGFGWLRQRFGQSIEIVTVAGNHSFYRRYYQEEIQAALKSAAAHNIYFLENCSVRLHGVDFVGATLWTDYALFGEASLTHAMHEAATKLNDHKKISWQKQPWSRFKPQHARNLHRKSVDYLSSLGTKNSARLIVTHHAPLQKSLPSMFKDALLSAAYASNLDNLIVDLAADIWVHGHIHSNSDYAFGDTRIICNPHGYGMENPSFNPELLVHVY